MLVSKKQRKLLEDFFRTGTRQTYAKGDTIVPPSDMGAGVHYIESGLVKTYDITHYGDENLLIMRKEGELLGLTYAITGSAKNVINAALAPTTAWFVPREDFIEFLQQNATAALPVLETVTQMYRLHSERIMTLEYRSVRERLASFLLNTADHFGETSPGGDTVICLPLTQQDIACSISASRETASRTLASFQQKGYVSVEASRITLKDAQALREIITEP